MGYSIMVLLFYIYIHFCHSNITFLLHYIIHIHVILITLLELTIVKFVVTKLPIPSIWSVINWIHNRKSIAKKLQSQFRQMRHQQILISVANRFLTPFREPMEQTIFTTKTFPFGLESLYLYSPRLFKCGCLESINYHHYLWFKN